nr:conotoxin A M14.10 [Conus magus]
MGMQMMFTVFLLVVLATTVVSIPSDRASDGRNAVVHERAPELDFHHINSVSCRNLHRAAHCVKLASMKRMERWNSMAQERTSRQPSVPSCLHCRTLQKTASAFLQQWLAFFVLIRDSSI